eukprot:TRINITY_DN2039_c0_g1_i1.p1 TRINITY_DN2039_c0_g1~~TRINITY_DN2039_c0_g1_i1.p1  ORF type:complete len:154 (+),score=10.84 TRINITY_DN2039_c0_g1_i1:105-566(+)
MSSEVPVDNSNSAGTAAAARVSQKAAEKLYPTHNFEFPKGPQKHIADKFPPVEHKSNGTFLPTGKGTVTASLEGAPPAETVAVPREFKPYQPHPDLLPRSVIPQPLARPFGAFMERLGFRTLPFVGLMLISVGVAADTLRTQRKKEMERRFHF